MICPLSERENRLLRLVHLSSGGETVSAEEARSVGSWSNPACFIVFCCLSLDLLILRLSPGKQEQICLFRPARFAQTRMCLCDLLHPCRDPGVSRGSLGQTSQAIPGCCIFLFVSFPERCYFALTGGMGLRHHRGSRSFPTAE